MAKTDFKSVDEYLATQPEGAREVLKEVRSIIRRALPGAEEVISYQIPAYKMDGVAVIYFAGWKEHFSLYPVGEAFARAFPDEARNYALSKGTIRLPLSEPVPVELIRKIVAMRVAEAAKVAMSRAEKKVTKRE